MATPNIETVARKVQKRESAHTAARERLLALFLKHAEDDTIATKAEVAAIVGTDYKMRRDVLAELAAQNIFFFVSRSKTKDTEPGDWRLANADRRFARADRGVRRVQQQASQLARLCASAEPELDAVRRVEARVLFAALNTASTILEDEHLDEITDTAAGGGDINKTVAEIVGRPTYR